VNRRAFLRGAAALAPAVILTPGLLMPVRKVLTLDKPMTATEILALRHAKEIEWAALHDYVDRIVFPPLIVFGETRTEFMHLDNSVKVRLVQEYRKY